MLIGTVAPPEVRKLLKEAMDRSVRSQLVLMLPGAWLLLEVARDLLRAFRHSADPGDPAAAGGVALLYVAIIVLSQRQAAISRALLALLDEPAQS